jgi:hypothetical protein
MAQYFFGAGTLTVAGQAVGVLKEVTLDISFSVKSLMGQNQFPVDVARGPGKVSGKAKYANIHGSLVAAALGGTAVQGDITYTNAAMGAGSSFALSWTGTFRAQTVSFSLPAVTISQFSIGFKNEDYAEEDLSFEAFADSGGQVIVWTGAEQ